ncbi:hypothetical protein ACWOBZ_07060 [Gemella bergeri]
MNKMMKYILGFVGIFSAALVCVFGIVKYEEYKEQNTVNESANLVNVNKQDLSKETTVILEKINNTTDIENLKSLINLDSYTIDAINNYNSRLSYAVDNSSGEDKIVVKTGGYYKDNKAIDINRWIGIYKVSNNKLEKTNDNIEDLKAKIKDKLKWNNFNLKNTKHNRQAAYETVRTYIFHIHDKKGYKLQPVTLFGYLPDPDKIIRGTGDINGFTVISLQELTDIYNTVYPDTYNDSQVKDDIINVIKNSNTKEMYKEIDDSFEENGKTILSDIKLGETVFFKKDNIYLTAMGGIGGASPISPLEDISQYKEDGERIIVPIIDILKNGRVVGEYVLRLNNKHYEGGNSPSKYYIEEIRQP